MPEKESHRVIENIWIPMSDGCSLAAKLWLPKNVKEEPVPAILEYIPYRKRDHKAIRDEKVHAFFASHGYAGVRVDIRGSGDSEGILRDEYLKRELDDGLEILRWIANQAWCSGKVGIFGISWGGFNGLQLASLGPPELGAVISVCSSDDRYADDVHYMGGCLLTDNLSWASTMFGFNSCPPDPLIVGEKWRSMWLERLEGSGLWIKNWLLHQRRDEFWRHASACEDYDAIRVPVMAVSGWADGYSNTVFRLLKNLKAPCKGLVGPWGHKYPHLGGLGPTIDFLGECLTWWDKWLKGKDLPAKVEKEEPMLWAWMQDTCNPMKPERPGRWVAEYQWPSPKIERKTYHIREHKLVEWDGSESEEKKEEVLTIQSPLSVGLFAGKWCSYSESTDLPWDQREEDGGALIFDTEALDEDLEILGAVEVELELSSDKEIAMVALRLSDLAPNDRATRVTFGVLNLCHRSSHEAPEELERDKVYSVRVKMNDVAQRFPAGNRIRLAISTSYWPLAWPAPEPVKLTIHPNNCRLHLPRRTPRESDKTLRSLGEGRSAPAPKSTLLAPAERDWTVVHNLASNEVSLNVVNNDARLRLDDIDLTICRKVKERFSYRNNRYDTLRAEVTQTRLFQRRDWDIATIGRTVLTSTRTHFIVRATLDAYEGDVRVFSKSWNESIPRDLI